MKDIFDREIKDGDFVIVKPTGRDSHGLHLGVIIGTSVMLRRYDWNPYITRYDQYYLVENPTQLEIDYINKMKQDYQKVLEEKEKEKTQSKPKPTIKKKDMVIGGYYYDRGIYIGKVEVTESYYDIQAGVYDNCFIKPYIFRPTRIEVGIWQSVHGSCGNSIFTSTKTFPKIYEKITTLSKQQMDLLIKSMEERKEYVNTSSMFKSNIPKLKLLDLGIEI